MSGVRPFRATDLPALADLESVLFGEEAWSAQVLGELAATGGRRLWVAQRDQSASDQSASDPGEVVGYALTGVQGDFAELLRIGVAPHAQRSGVASRLLGVALSSARRDGVDRMLLEVSEANTAGRGFYARHGFTEIDRRAAYYRDGSTALVLQADLPPLDTDQSRSGRMES